MYANLTVEQQHAIVKSFRLALALGATDAMHAAAIAAHEILAPTVRGWNGKKGSNAFAAALTVLAHRGIVAVTVNPEAPRPPCPCGDMTIDDCAGECGRLDR